MKAVVWRGVGDIRLDDVPDPKIQDLTDAIVRITRSAICGTDLHFVRGTMAPMREGTILGHEGSASWTPSASGSGTPRPGAPWAPGVPSQASRWAIEAVAKAGTIGIIGVYSPDFETYPIGQAMNKT